jgi:AAA domain
VIFTYEQSRKYFSYRLPYENISARDSVSVRCPFHGDRTASMAIKLSNAVWMCHAGCGGGGILDFERKMFPGGDLDSWWADITRICGLEPNRKGKRDLGELVATYDYTDATGKLVFQKLRYEPKNFLQRAPNGKGGWDYRLTGITKPLYRLPELITCPVAMVAEGEKDADALRALDWQSLKNGKPLPAVSATCNFDGAGPGKWKDEYSPYFAGRMVVIFPDNDEPGRVHGAEVAASVSRYAHSVKVVELSGLAEHGDVSDYLVDHTVSDLAAIIQKTPHWEALQEDAKAAKPFFVCPSEIMRGSMEVEWLVPGMIHRGGKGLIVAAPKAGKSMIALDLAVALASQQSWLGQPCISRPVKTAVVSREDGPGMTKRRVAQFAQARGVTMDSLDAWLRFNTYEQKGSFSIQSDADLDEAIRWIKQEQIGFCIFDVLNILHGADENSNTAMTQVMKRFDSIRAATGVDLAIIHHDAKNAESGNKKPRGASAIDSWWEWKISISPDAEDESVKRVHFGSKAAVPHAAMTIEFRTDGEAMLIVPAVGRR